MHQRIDEAIQQAGQRIGEFAQWAKPAVGDALNQQPGINIYGPEDGPDLTLGQGFASGVVQIAVRHAAQRLRRGFTSGPHEQASQEAPASDEADGTDHTIFDTVKDRASDVKGKTLDFISWLTPAATDALKDGTGIDAYEFLGKEQPTLDRDQKFASAALRFAGGIVASKAARRMAAAAAAA